MVLHIMPGRATTSILSAKETIQLVRCPTEIDQKSALANQKSGLRKGRDILLRK